MLAGLALSSLLLAQDSPQGPATFRSDARLVVLHASVVDKNGKLVPALKQDQFHVFENNQEQAIKDFRQEDVPVSLGILVDNSGSMRDKRQKVEAAALAMVKASNPQDEVFIVNFNDEAFLDQPFTGDLKKLEEGLTRIDSRGGTALRDAIGMSIDYIKQEGKRDKKVLLVVTDGNDNVSSGTLERLLQKARQSEVLIYSIGLLNEEDRREAKKAKRALDMLAVESGGLAAYPKTANEVEPVTLQVAHELRNQYIITYKPNAEPDGSYRQIKVAVNAKGSPTVRTRSGYYATPDNQPPKSSGQVSALPDKTGH